MEEVWVKHKNDQRNGKVHLKRAFEAQSIYYQRETVNVSITEPTWWNWGEGVTEEFSSKAAKIY